MTRAPRVVVVGGGFSGAMTAAHLAARGIATTVIEPGRLGRGVAYAATSAPLLLNTPASAMSALPDVPDHFEAWLQARPGTDTVPAPRPSAPSTAVFAPRARYGDYLEDTIAQLAGGGLDVIAARALEVVPGSRGFTVRCDEGSEVTGERLVLALGNPPPRTPAAIEPGTPGYLADPYRAIDDVAADEPVAILGTGLTALDVVAGLRSRGHRAAIVCVSRRGLVPVAHGRPPRGALQVPRELVRQPRLHALLAWWRACTQPRGAADPSAARGPLSTDEAAVIAALRPLLPTIWRRLPAADRARFVRHVRPRWDALRHRAPPSIRAAFDLGIAEGSIEQIAGRLAAAQPAAHGLCCRFVTADGEVVERTVRWLINCTGPERDVRRLRTPLVQSLRARGLVAADPLGLGAVTGPAGELVGDAGVVPGAFVVGPWRIADLWEASAVPELRVLAADTAATLAAELAPATQRLATEPAQAAQLQAAS